MKRASISGKGVLERMKTALDIPELKILKRVSDAHTSASRKTRNSATATYTRRMEELSKTK